MSTKSDTELLNAEIAEVVDQNAQVEMSLGDLEMVAGGHVITSFL